MLKNYLKIAFRNLLKDKVFSLINIFGLSVGMASFLLILQYVQFEKSYDKFLTNAENIYRVSLDQYRNNELSMTSAENYPGVGPAFKQEFPEVIDYARLYNMGYKNNVVITYEDAPNGPIQFKHRRFLYADSSFLSMLGYPMHLGDAATSLTEPFSAVISETYANKYFGDTNPIGKTLRLRDDDYNDETCKVTGVFKDLPANTHLKFDVLFSYKTLFNRGDWAPGRYDQSWQRKDMYTYIQVRPGTDPQQLEAKFPTVVTKYNPGLAEQNRRDELHLQSLTNIHLHSNLAEEAEPNGDARAVYFLGIIAIFILIIAWVNYINLSTARAMERANEVGLRKAMGAFKDQLIWQFLSESAIINFFAILLTLLLMILVLPIFNQLAGLSLPFSSLFSGWFVALIPLLWIVGTLLSGIYPAFVLSSFLPASVLKGKLRNSGSGILLRRILVIFQFMASVFLIAGTFIVYQQLNFMRNQDIGVNIDRVLVVERPGVSSRDRDAFTANVDAFRDELLKEPSIKAVSASVTIPGKKREYKVGVKRYGHSDDELVTLRFNSMDYQFMDVFEMKVVAGRGFSEDFVNDPDTSVIIAESSARMLGFEKPEDAVGQTLTIRGFNWHPIVAGVVNDYHQESLKKSKDPMIFYCTLYGGEFYSMKVNTGNLQKTIDHARASWEKAFPGNPFEYFFLDDYFNAQYENDQKFGNLFAVFAVIAIIVGCLGLFGLSAFTAHQRTKEIGIRKVLGSSVIGIMVLLSKDFAKLVLLACLIGLPLLYISMNKWLQGFATRIDINWFLLIASGIIVLIIALITVSYQTFRAAVVNPSKSLKYE
ncbi:ABC transporter permease [Fulvivirgaceae bacterium BMA10]|uniref:ABC transporter permease n=1 Tax=Splendidivirga corallicola TaxID=3051826 RepID=A0ABT8KQI5_9BACT|nr:ABC transporter permease [Fulvivirgaceae bacterium BMA10]